MDHSIYPEGVEVHQRDLAFTESSKAAAINANLVATTTQGIASGLGVTVNAITNYYVDIAAGVAYTPRGDRVTLTSAQLAVPLASYTLNTKNYIILVYDELPSLPEAHETSGAATFATRATGFGRIVVNSTLFANWTSSDDAVLTNNAIDRAVILATVTAQGVATSVANHIQMPEVFGNAISAAMPATPSVTGVSILSTSQNTAVGNMGALAYVNIGKTLSWKAHGDTTIVTTSITTTGTYVLTSPDSGSTLTVSVNYAALPISDVSDSITVTDTYSLDAPMHRFTATDKQHRGMIGSGLPTVKNPHGLTYDDLGAGSSGSINDHQYQMHANGIWHKSSAGLLKATVVTGTPPHSLNIAAFGPADMAFVSGKRVTAVSGSTSILFDGTQNPIPIPDNGTMFGIYIDQNGNLLRSQRAQFTTTGGISDYIQLVNCSDDIGATSFTISTIAGVAQFDGGQAISIPATPDVIRLYSSNHVSWLELYINPTITSSLSTVTVAFTAEPDLTKYMPLSYVYLYTVPILLDKVLGYGFHNTANAPNYITDRRKFGNISTANLSTDLHYNDKKSDNSVIFENGIYIRTGSPLSSLTLSDWYLSTSGLTLTINGGAAFIDGVRYDIPTTTKTLTASTINYVYISNGYIDPVDATLSIPAGTIRVSTTSWSSLQDVGIKLKVFTVGVGSVTLATDYRHIVGVPSSRGDVYVADPSSAQVAASPNTPMFYSIEGALDYISSGCGRYTMVLGPGTHYAASGVTIPNGISVLGDATSGLSIVKLRVSSSSTPSYVFNCMGNNNISDLHFNGPGTGSTTPYAIIVSGSNVNITNVVIEEAGAPIQNINIRGASTSSVVLNNVDSIVTTGAPPLVDVSGGTVALTGIQIINCSALSKLLTADNSVTISNIRIDKCSVAGDGAHVVTFDGTTASSISITDSQICSALKTIGAANIHDIIISSCLINGYHAAVVVLSSTTTIGALTISGNQISTDASAVATYGYSGSFLDLKPAHLYYVTISDNIIIDTQSAILMYLSSSDGDNVIISGNQFINVKQILTFIVNNSSNVGNNIVSDNIVENTAFATQCMLINCRGITITNNRMRVNSCDICINLTTIYDAIICNNYAFKAGAAAGDFVRFNGVAINTMVNSNDTVGFLTGVNLQVPGISDKSMIWLNIFNGATNIQIGANLVTSYTINNNVMW